MFSCYSILPCRGELVRFSQLAEKAVCWFFIFFFFFDFFLSMLPYPLWNFVFKIVCDLIQSNLKCQVSVFCVAVMYICPNPQGRRKCFFFYRLHNPWLIWIIYIYIVYICTYLIEFSFTSSAFNLHHVDLYVIFIGSQHR